MFFLGKEQDVRSAAVVFLAGGTLVLSLAFLISPKRDFSENENRYLEKFPAFAWEHVFDGSYMESWDAYLSDHFPLRRFFMGCKARYEILAGKREINQVFIAEDGYLIDVYKAPENTDRIAGILKEFAQNIEDTGVTPFLMLVPTAIYTYQEKLPPYARVPDQMETMQRIYEEAGIPAVDVGGALLAHKDGAPLYYRTDHHWTTYGAYIGYQEYCRAAGFEPVPLGSLAGQDVTDAFCGTAYSKVNDYSHPGDTITIYVNPRDKLKVCYEDTGEVSDSLYNLEYLAKKDKYSLFLNNLHPLVTVSNETADSRRELVLVKDSYANSMVPFLARHYNKIYIFDTRYYKLGPSAFIKEHPSVTDVLILYNMGTLDADLGVRGIY